MLSKNNKILIGCLALLLVMSVGYALFSDTITINGTATAKGDFDITATCQPGVSSKLGTIESLGLSAEGGYENDSCTVTDDVVSANVDFKYPGARRLFTVKFTNNGTIDASVNLSRVVSSSEYMSDELCVHTGETKECKKSELGVTTYLKNYRGLAYIYPGAIEDPDGNLIPENELGDFILDYEKLIFLIKPGYSCYLIYELSIDHIDLTISYPGEEMFVEYYSTVNIPFEQVTQ